jgi:hypothetical protein
MLIADARTDQEPLPPPVPGGLPPSNARHWRPGTAMPQGASPIRHVSFNHQSHIYLDADDGNRGTWTHCGMANLSMNVSNENNDELTIRRI